MSDGGCSLASDIDRRRSMNVLLVDPSDRGGIASYTGMLAEAIRSAGGSPELLGSRNLGAGPRSYPVHKALPPIRWGRPRRRTLSFYAERASGWSVGAFTVARAVMRLRPDVVHFQAPLNRRFDRFVLGWIRRHAP